MIYSYKGTKGSQGRQSFWLITIPFHALASLVTINPEVQRKASSRRINSMANYICGDPAYWLPAVTLAAPGGLRWDAKSGLLSWDDTTKLSVIDGQHRIKAILLALESEHGERLENDLLPAMVFANMQTERQADLFSVMNGEARPVSKAVRELRNYRTRANRIAHDVIANLGLSERVENFASHVHITNSASKTAKAQHWFCFSWLVDANRYLIRSLDTTDETNASRIACDYWKAVFTTISPFLGDLDNYVASSAASFMALGRLGGALVTEYDDWEERVSRLANVNWSRRGGFFEGTMIIGGQWKRGTGGQLPATAAAPLFAAAGINPSQD